MRNNNKILSLLSILFLLLSEWGCVLFAQNNVFGINDSLYEIYRRGEKVAIDSRVLLVTDTLSEQARAIGDTKAECLSAALVVNYYMQSKFSVDELLSHTKYLKHLARKYEHLQYYYYAIVFEVQKHLGVGNNIEAMHLANTMRDEAYADNDAFGIYICHVTMGRMYASRRNMYRACDEFEKAKDLVLNSDILPSPVTALYYCARSKFEIGKYEEALNDIYFAFDASHIEPRINLLLLCVKCLSEFNLGMYNESRATIAEIKKVEASFVHVEESIESQIDAIRLLLDGQTEDAIEYTQKNLHGAIRAKLLATIYCYLGQYDRALVELDSARYYLADRFDQLFNEDVSAINAAIKDIELSQHAQELQIEKNRLEIDNHDLEMQREVLKLKRAQLEVQQQHAALELQNSLVENKKLELQNQTLQLQRQDMEIEKRSGQLKIDEHRRQRNSYLTKLVVGLSLIILLGVGIYLFVRDRNLKRLSRQHMKLIMAKLKAEENMLVAEENEQKKTAFIQSMSHEIRTPLNAICGFSQILADPETADFIDEEEKERMCNLIQENTELLTTIVNDILYISDLESGKSLMNIEEVPVQTICKNALREVINKVPEGVELNYASDLDAEFVIKTDSVRVQQVLVNFLSNAVKYTEKGEICLYCIHGKSPENIELAVTDTGVGVPEGMETAIFDRFVKLDTFKHGTGLGLSICKLIAKNLGGRVLLDRTYRKGSRFVFIHPLEAILPKKKEVES